MRKFNRNFFSSYHSCILKRFIILQRLNPFFGSFDIRKPQYFWCHCNWVNWFIEIIIIVTIIIVSVAWLWCWLWCRRYFFLDFDAYTCIASITLNFKLTTVSKNKVSISSTFDRILILVFRILGWNCCNFYRCWIICFAIYYICLLYTSDAADE